MNWLGDARLAEHALSPAPVWLWRADAARVLWCNPAAATIFDADTPKALAQRDFEPDHPGAAQIARLAGTLPQGGAPRLERLRGFGAKIGDTLTCLCSRIVLADNTVAVLVVSTERAGRDVSLPERALALHRRYRTAGGDLFRRRRFDRGPADRARASCRQSRPERARRRETGARGKSQRHGFRRQRRRTGDDAAARRRRNDRAADAVYRARSKPAQARHGAPSPAARLPFRFLWQMDAATRITHGAENFAGVIGPQAAEILARPWAEVASELQLDSDGRVARALDARETWSGIAVAWPIAGTNERVTIEMSGMPVFDRERNFQGFRGFGICRETARLDEILSRAAQGARQRRQSLRRFLRLNKSRRQKQNKKPCKKPRKKPRRKLRNILQKCWPFRRRRPRSPRASTAPLRNWRANLIRA